MDKPTVIITVNRRGRSVDYKIECSNKVSTEELTHYLDEIIEGICNWRPGVCEETVQTIVGSIKEKTEGL